MGPESQAEQPWLSDKSESGVRVIAGDGACRVYVGNQTAPMLAATMCVVCVVCRWVRVPLWVVGGACCPGWPIGGWCPDGHGDIDCGGGGEGGSIYTHACCNPPSRLRRGEESRSQLAPVIAMGPAP